jgi:aspartate racemase
MKTIGMIGGLSWESSSVYYQLINRAVQKRLGGMHSAKTLMYSFDFEDMEAQQSKGRWDEAAKLMADGAARLSSADFLILCCNTAHRMADAAQQAAGIPLLHIADPLGAKIRADGASRVGLIGSVHTMGDGRILMERLKRHYDLDIVVPDEPDRIEVDRVIKEELCRGQFLEASRANYRAIIARLVAKGCDGVILGCTEIPLLVKPGDATVPLYDTTTLHAMAAVDMALA